MRLLQETIDNLAKQGINVRYYPEETRKEFEQRVWKSLYDYSYNYSKYNIAGIAEQHNTNVLFQTVEELEEHSRKFADRALKRHCDPYEYDTLFITYDNGKQIVKKESVKSKEITEDFVLKLVAKSRKLYAGYYGEFTLAMQRICRERGFTSNFSVYPTTYGIGVWLFWNWKADEHIAKVESILKEKGIEYYNEYSDHRFVYRFKVSKKRENIARMCA